MILGLSKMKISVLYIEDVVDCTADPHYVYYKTLNEIFKDVEKVLRSNLVYAIPTVYAYDQSGNFLAHSDSYHLEDLYEKNKKATGLHAKKHKIEGLYWQRDPDEEIKYHLLPGLTGYLGFLKLIRDKPEVRKQVKDIYIDVVWSAFMQSNCSDHIVIHLNQSMVDYSNQDYYIDNKTYPGHIKKLEELLGKEIEMSDRRGEDE